MNKRTLCFSLLYKHGNQGRKKWNKLEKNEIKTFNSSFSRDIFITAENRDDGLNRLKIVVFLFSCSIWFLLKRLLLLYNEKTPLMVILSIGKSLHRKSKIIFLNKK